jgi:hypothetical protein
MSDAGRYRLYEQSGDAFVESPTVKQSDE